MAGREEYILERILNENRGFLIDDTTDYTSQTNIAGIIILEDTVISNLEITGDTSVLAAMNLTAKTLTTFFPPIMAGKDKRFSRIKLTSGSVWAIMTTDDGIVS